MHIPEAGCAEISVTSGEVCLETESDSKKDCSCLVNRGGKTLDALPLDISEEVVARSEEVTDKETMKDFA